MNDEYRNNSFLANSQSIVRETKLSLNLRDSTKIKSFY